MERDEELIAEQEAAAAQEAGGVGGRARDDVDPAEVPRRESGEGVAEGFELAEEALVDHAEHTTGEGIPRPDQMGEEAEPETASYGEPDREDKTDR